jgi:hypothetical protein
MAGWDNERALLHAEVTQRQDEGCTVPPSLVDAIAALTSPADDWDEVRTAPLWRRVHAAPLKRISRYVVSVYDHPLAGSRAIMAPSNCTVTRSGRDGTEPRRYVQLAAAAVMARSAASSDAVEPAS